MSGAPEQTDPLEPRREAPAESQDSAPPAVVTYPWEALWEDVGRPVDARWTLELASSRSALWPLLADTSGLNERLGLPPMEFEERDGLLHGASGGWLFRQEWVEIPWEWEAGKWLRAERRYSRGFARVVRVCYLLADHQGGSRLTIYIGWIPRSRVWRPLLRYVNRWLRTQYARVLRDLDELAANQIAAPLSPPSNTLVGVDESRLQNGIRELVNGGFSPAEAERLGTYLRTASDQSLFRIRPKMLAFEWGMELEDLLALLLQATRTGLLRLSWDVLCPHCLGVRKESRSLGDLREFGRCDICDIDFSATSRESIEVSFRVLSEIRQIPEVFYCSAEPAKKPHIILQQLLGPDESYQSDLTLASGRYRLRRAIGDGGSLSLEVVKTKGARSLTWNPHDHAGGGAPLAISDRVQLNLRNPDAEPVSIVLEKVPADPTALRPAELFNLQRFRDLFSRESIATGLKLEIGYQTLLFTDIVGSTRLYSELGDTRAFNAVHSHFVVLQELIAAHRGAVVKTIGDAMMAGFQHPEDALKAAVEIQKKFPPDGPQTVTLRVSLHRGICLAVRLESNIDYFGNAVNFAAKMQSAAGAGEIVLSSEFYGLNGMADRARELGLSVAPTDFSLPAMASAKPHQLHLASLPV